MDPNSRRRPIDAPGQPEIDGELASHLGCDGQVEVAVIEHLRVKVPAAARQAWLEAEEASWEPWLQRQAGYLGRELLWDAEHQEGQLLIRWASRELWQAIPLCEVDQVQERFERLAHAALERLGVLLPEAAVPGVTPSGAPCETSAQDVTLQTPKPNPFPLVYSGELPPDASLDPVGP